MSAISYFKSLGVRILNELPPLWRIKEGANTQPAGYVWVDNGLPMFIKDENNIYKYNHNYEQALLLIEK